MLECRSDITNDSCEELAENISVLESNRQFKDNVGNIGDYEGEGVGQTEVEYLQSVNSMILSLTVPQPVFSTLIGRGMSKALERSSLVLYGIWDKWLPCTERIYYRRPYAIKNQRRARNTPQWSWR